MHRMPSPRMSRSAGTTKRMTVCPSFTSAVVTGSPDPASRVMMRSGKVASRSPLLSSVMYSFQKVVSKSPTMTEPLSNPPLVTISFRATAPVTMCSPPRKFRMEARTTSPPRDMAFFIRSPRSMACRRAPQAPCALA